MNAIVLNRFPTVLYSQTIEYCFCGGIVSQGLNLRFTVQSFLGSGLFLIHGPTVLNSHTIDYCFTASIVSQGARALSYGTIVTSGLFLLDNRCLKSSRLSILA